MAAATLPEIPARKVLSAWIPPPEVEKELILRGFSPTTYGENGRLDVRVTVNAGGEDYLQLREEKLNLCKDGSDSVNILSTRLSRRAKAASALYKYSDPSNQSECVRSTARSKGQEQHRHRM